MSEILEKYVGKDIVYVFEGKEYASRRDAEEAQRKAEMQKIIQSSEPKQDYS